jgi:hypothetical protein
MDHSSPHSTDEQRMISQLGVRLVAYLLSIDEAKAARIFEGTDTGELDSNRQAAIQFLITRNEQLLASIDDRDWIVTSEWSNTLASGIGFAYELRGSFANEMRLFTSNEERAQTSRPTNLNELLAELAREVYPLYLLPSAEQHFRPHGVSQLMWRSSWRSDLEKYIMEDSAFAALLTERDDIGPRSKHVWWSSGHSATIQLAVLSETFVYAGWERARLVHATPSVEQFVNAVQENRDE